MHGVTGYVVSTPNANGVVQFSGNAVGTPDRLESQVIADMIRSNQTLKVDKMDPEQLGHQVGARVAAVLLARNSQFGFATGKNTVVNQTYWMVNTNRSGEIVINPRSGVDMYNAVLDPFLNPGKYKIGCFPATKLAQIAGIAATLGDHDKFNIYYRSTSGNLLKDTSDRPNSITGDRTWIQNPLFGPQSADGTEGENMLNIGGDRWWGHPGNVVDSTLGWRIRVGRWDGAPLEGTNPDRVVPFPSFWTSPRIGIQD